MITAKVRYIWDRHHRADSRNDKAGNIELRISLDNKYKYITTGISVPKSRWNDKEQMVQGIAEAQQYNLTLSQIRTRVLEILSEMDRDGFVDLASIPDRLKNKTANITFLEYVELRILARQKTKAFNTIRRYEVWLGKMQEWGVIKSFSDITPSNINKMDEWLHGRGLKDETIYGYHKNLRMFVYDAIVDGYLKENPYQSKKIKVKRGEPNIHCYVTEEELKKIMEVVLATECLNRVRDLFVFQAFTGMAYADMFSFDFKQAKKTNGLYVLDGKRQKSGVPYHFVLLDEAVRILEKYDWELPYISNQKYNYFIKVVAEKCEIDKPVASHWARRTAGMMMLNNGVPIGIVSRILGHASVRTTEHAYAFLLDKTIDEAMIKFGERIKKKGAK